MEGATATGSLNNDDGDSRVVYQHFEDLADSSTRSESLTQRLRQHLHGNSCGSSVNVNFSASSGDGDDSGAGGRITAADELRDELRREPGALADYMRFKLRFHFMNPIEKWKTRGRFPLKLTLQIIKLIVVTIQVIVFGMDSGSFQTRHRNTYMALEHILLKDWDTSRDVLVYPPPAGPYAVHTKQGFYEHANHVIAQYSTITTAPIGTFGYSSPNGEIVPIRFCETSYRHGTVWPFNSTLDFNGVVHLGKKLSWTDELQFVDFWFIMIILADGILQAGSAVKMQIEERLLPGFMHDACSLLLGCGTLLAWCGLLRYVGYFQTYNILLLTLKKSIPNVIRFLLCAMLLFCGYVMCGWVVIGPHHIKFRTLSTAAECLFSIMNGDDIFATYAMLFEKNSLVWYFAQAYMYSFVVLFVYLVVSLFVAIFVDAYETIRDTEAESAPSTIQAFIAEVMDDPASGLYRFDDELEKRLGSRNLLKI
ncbi:mucolipin, putative [Ixodes scapularis]|uniref:Mucolipin, putative n=1 Tax=Ixodes scapularis TaxID=6945 RepID=B7P4R0_IXOSC|nr:mucolipin, putative [Ixodes scapularis]|eukprot:XP_002406355.1 mucolipin, putative [Ixodes scapularis]